MPAEALPPLEPPAPVRSRAGERTPARSAAPIVLDEAPDLPAAPRASSPSPVEPPRRAPDTLGGEVSVLRDARVALERGDARKALNLLDRHAALHPRGALVEEQLAARALSLCALGRAAEARSVSARLERLAPRSPHLPRIRASCTEGKPRP
jgi:hypothetical protein